MKSLREYEAELVELEATIARLKREIKVGDVVKLTYNYIGVVKEIVGDYATVTVCTGSEIRIGKNQIARATSEETKEFENSLKRHCLMIGENGLVVPWMPNVGEEYYKIRVDVRDITENIVITKGIRHSNIDSLYTNCFPTKAMALSSI